MSTVQNLLEQEYMTLAPGVGIVPEKFRNLGFKKLGYAAGEGGIRRPSARDQDNTAGTSEMQAFLAGIAAGADPQEFAKNMLAGDDTKTTTGRGRRGSQEA